MRLVHSSQFTVHSKAKRWIALVAVCVMLFASAIQAAAISIQELVENGAEYDAQRVTIQGEVIGDILVQQMVRGEFRWINVRDTTNSLGIFCSAGSVTEIEHLGRYGYQGDIVSVQGVFNRFCSQHGGETDLHAERVSIVQRGKSRWPALAPEKVRASIILPVLALLLAIIHLIIRKR